MMRPADPDAVVIALSPEILLATNRYICEICHKGFQRDQNLQLHRRGHNLPWKLKLKSSKDGAKKVYVCPEPTCIHHHPSRALGDLTGIKKHYCRKHGEKKWKCDRCAKVYAVQSDWKAHSKVCRAREYVCECGTPFTRKESLTSHRAFCDALVEGRARVFATATAATTGTCPTMAQYSTAATGTYPTMAQYSAAVTGTYPTMAQYSAAAAAIHKTPLQLSLQLPPFLPFSSLQHQHFPYLSPAQNPNPNPRLPSHARDHVIPEAGSFLSLPAIHPPLINQEKINLTPSLCLNATAPLREVQAVDCWDNTTTDVVTRDFLGLATGGSGSGGDNDGQGNNVGGWGWRC